MKPVGVVLGCDPEFFIKFQGKVIGSETLLGTKGIAEDGYGKVIVDGVQAEINPEADTCRELLLDNISTCIDMVARRAIQFDLDFSQGVKIEPEEFEALSPECKQFGCKPSFNTRKGFPELIQLDASKYPFRSAGGHVHLGAGNSTKLLTVLQDPMRVIKVLDVVLGNTCVLLDRSVANVERRKHYGRAGEFRLPKYGIEYRTLSNFWLRHPALASLVFGLARHAVEICYHDLDADLMALVDYDKVAEDIDSNNFAGALETWNKIKYYLIDTIDSDVQADTNGHYPIDEFNLNQFEKIVQDGVEAHFGDNPVQNWIERDGDYLTGFYDYSLTIQM